MSTMEGTKGRAAHVPCFARCSSRRSFSRQRSKHHSLSSSSSSGRLEQGYRRRLMWTRSTASRPLVTTEQSWDKMTGPDWMSQSKWVRWEIYSIWLPERVEEGVSAELAPPERLACATAI